MNEGLQIGRVKAQPSGNFNKNGDALSAHLYKLRNRNGLEATITNYDARLTSLLLKNRNGNLIDIIAVPDKTDLPDTCKANTGGVVWDAKQVNDHIVELNYPKRNTMGNLKAKVTYFLNDFNRLKIVFEINTDKRVVINPADIVSFNLNGRNNGNVLNHQVCIKADNYLPVDENIAITGKIEGVANTPFDFRNSATIGSRINDHHLQLTNGNGYNHNFVLNKHASRTPAARVKGDKSGIVMEIFTDQPGLRFNGGNLGDDGSHAAFAMKINRLGDLHAQLQFAPAPLRPGHVYRSVICYLLKN